MLCYGVATMDRRTLIKTGILAGAAFSAAPRVFAQPASPTAARDLQLAELAKREIALAGSALWHRDLVAIADFGLHSASKRFHFVDMDGGRVDSFLVTHGYGSDKEHDGWLKRYSNIEESLCTCRGSFRTRSWYDGKYGTSMRIDGMDPTNSNALPRAIVMHPADYATEEHVQRWGKLGRSDGCFAMDPAKFHEALIRLSGGRLLFAGSLGLAEDGSVVTPPDPQTDMLPQTATGGTIERDIQRITV